MSLSQFENDQGGAFPLREYLAVLRNRKWLIMVVAAAAVAASLFVTLRQTPIYTSSAEVLVRPTGDCTLGPCFNLQTEALVALSPDVAAEAADELDSSPQGIADGLSVTNTTDTEILVFSYSHPDPSTAQERADAFAGAYLDNRSNQALEQLAQASESVTSEISELQTQLKGLNEKISDSEDSAERATLSQRAGFVRLSIQTLEQQLIEDTSSSTLDVGQIVRDAYLPSAPTSPQPRRSAALALALGLVIGVSLALVRERLDDRLDGRADLETHAAATVLGVIPRVNSWKGNGPYLVTDAQPFSNASEAYKALRTGLLFGASQRNIKSIMVTSANEGEGKTSTCANLGVVLALAGKVVVIISADLRRPRLHEFFKIRSSQGLTNVLAGEVSLHKVIHPAGPVAGLNIMPSGPIPGNPAELLGSEEMDRVIRTLEETTDFVLIDVPPILPVTDATTLAPHVDAVLYIADASRTTRSTVAHARTQLDQVNARLIGAVLNNFDQKKARGYAGNPELHYSYRPEPRSRSVRALALLRRSPKS